MKLLLVLGSDETYNLIYHYAKPLGFEFIRYSHILKAMDNIDEADPTGIIISARDFPWHWKAMVQFVRNERPKEICPIILLKGDDFTHEDSKEASYLGVNGILVEKLDNVSDMDRLQGLLNRYVSLDERRRNYRPMENHERFNFIFIHPNNTLVTGEIITISSTGLSFLPDNTSMHKGLVLNMEFTECSLRAGDAILNPICRLTGTGRIIALEFLSFQNQEQEILSKYLESVPHIEKRKKNLHPESVL